MSIVIKCEMCDHTHPFNPLDRPYERDVPDDWLILYRGDPQSNTAFDFCSEKCLLQWTTGNVTQEEKTDKPQLKMRRFIMTDIQRNDPVEGVQWADGRIYLDYGSEHCSSPRYHCSGIFDSPEDFDRTHEGYFVQRIDD